MQNPCRVLSIRDNSSDARLIQEFWGSDPQIELIATEHGDAAYTYLASETKLPSLVLLSSIFPEHRPSALQIITELKADARWRVIPIIMFTAWTDPKDAHDWYNAGISCIVPLPTDLAEIEARLAAVKHLWVDIAMLPHHTTRNNR